MQPFDPKSNSLPTELLHSNPGFVIYEKKCVPLQNPDFLYMIEQCGGTIVFFRRDMLATETKLMSKVISPNVSFFITALIMIFPSPPYHSFHTSTIFLV